jgi:hypothetical protein
MGRCEQPVLPNGRCPIDVGGAVLVEVTGSTSSYRETRDDRGQDDGGGDTGAVLGSPYQTHLRGAEKRVTLSCIAGADFPLTCTRVCIGNTSTSIIDSHLRLGYRCGAQRGSVRW